MSNIFVAHLHPRTAVASQELVVFETFGAKLGENTARQLQSMLIICTKDRMGLKGLYYYYYGGWIDEVRPLKRLMFNL